LSEEKKPTELFRLPEAETTEVYQVELADGTIVERRPADLESTRRASAIARSFDALPFAEQHAGGLALAIAEAIEREGGWSI
jgi:hypothetical protein